MQLEVNDVVFFIFNNKIYKGKLLNKITKPTKLLLAVQSAIGVLYLDDFEVYETVDKLVQAIIYKEPVNV
jgi:hypothetical protein